MTTEAPQRVLLPQGQLHTSQKHMGGEEWGLRRCQNKPATVAPSAPTFLSQTLLGRGRSRCKREILSSR